MPKRHDKVPGCDTEGFSELAPEVPRDLETFTRKAAEAVAEASGFTAEEILRVEQPFGGYLGDARNALLTILVEDTEFSLEEITRATNRKPNTKNDVPGSVRKYHGRIRDIGYGSGYETGPGEPLKGGPRKLRVLADARFSLGTRKIRQVHYDSDRGKFALLPFVD